MHKIMTLYDQICDTEKDARDFAECALKYKVSDRALAEVYVNLARADLDQCARLQTQLERVVAEHAAEHPDKADVYTEMSAWHTTKMSHKISEVKILLENYK